MWAEWLHCLLGVLNVQHTYQIKRADLTPPSQRPKCGQNGYMTPCIWGFPSAQLGGKSETAQI